MITFAELSAAAPDIAGPIADRFATTRLGLLGTTRIDGSPRVSPIEVAIDDGHLFVGMMPGSFKWRDVVRDPRYCLLTPVADSQDGSGDGKLFGEMQAVRDQQRADDFIRAHAESGGFDPEPLLGSPAFELLVSGAAWQGVEGDTWVTHSWTAAAGLRHRRREGASGPVVDV